MNTYRTTTNLNIPTKTRSVWKPLIRLCVVVLAVFFGFSLDGIVYSSIVFERYKTTRLHLGSKGADRGFKGGKGADF